MPQPADSHHYQRPGPHQPPIATPQPKTCILFLACVAFVAVSFLIVVAIDAIRTSSSRQYAAALIWQHNSAHTCDAALGRRRYWFGPIVQGTELCTFHDQNSSKVRVYDDATVSFLVLGDWGRDGMCCQRDVAAEMSIAAAKMNPQFVVSTGDNFYPFGIDYANDTQVGRSWREVYVTPHKSMHDIPWKITLGNHDHVKNGDAQVQLSKMERLWHMPSRYFFETTRDGQLFMAFLDTTVMYYDADTLNSDFGGEVVTDVYRDKQLEDFKKAISETTARWKIVFGHHPFFASAEHGTDERKNMESLSEKLLPIFKQGKVSAYFGGHEHTQEHHFSDGIHFFVSGAGSKVRQLEQNGAKAVFAIDRQGYMAVSVRPAREELNVQVVDMQGSVLHVARVSLL